MSVSTMQVGHNKYLEDTRQRYYLEDCILHKTTKLLRVFSMWGGNTMRGWWRWALVSPDGVAPSRMVGVSASVNLPLHHEVQKFLFWHQLTQVVPEKGL